MHAIPKVVIKKLFEVLSNCIEWNVSEWLLFQAVTSLNRISAAGTSSSEHNIMVSTAGPSCTNPGTK